MFYIIKCIVLDLKENCWEIFYLINEFKFAELTHLWERISYLLFMKKHTFFEIPESCKQKFVTIFFKKFNFYFIKG